MNSLLTTSKEGNVYEGLQVRLRTAPFWKRFFAYAADVAIVSCILYGVLLAAIFTGAMSLAFFKALAAGSAATKGFAVGTLLITLVFLLVILALYHGYFVYFESKNGYTPGKKLFGLQVTSTKGGRLTFGQCFLRDMMRYIDCVLIFPGLISVLLTQKAQRLGDLMAGTVVIHSAHQEDSSNFLYMKQEDYLVLYETWAPSPVPEDVCRHYLEFAYPVFCQAKEPTNYLDVEKWQDISLNFVHPKSSESIEQRTLLLFFAELCFQTFQKTHGSPT